MTLGSHRPHARDRPLARMGRILAVSTLSCAVLAACSDRDGEQRSTSSPSTSSASDPATSEPTEEPSPSEATPTIEPATGLLLSMDSAEIRMPKGWKRFDNFNVPFIRQGGGKLFGTLTWTEIKTASVRKSADSLDEIARLHMRNADDPGLKRVKDAVIGGDTVAYRMILDVDGSSYEEHYGVLIGNIQYGIRFHFTLAYGTRAEAVATIQSILATWDFNP